MPKVRVQSQKNEFQTGKNLNSGKYIHNMVKEKLEFYSPKSRCIKDYMIIISSWEE